MKVIFQISIFCISAMILNAQNVGIGIAAPTEKLDVAGNIKTLNLFVTGYMGINTTAPAYRLHLNDGSLAFTNSVDNSTWIFGYNSTQNFLALTHNSAIRMVFNNTGNVGVGTPTPTYKLDVNGSLGATSAAIEGNLTVNNGFGIIRNGQSSTQLKYFTFTGSFGFTNFAGHTVSGPHQVNFPASAGFTNTPRVMISNYTSIGGTAGHLFSIVPSIINVTTSGFQIYFFNSSTAAATMDFTLSYVCIGN